MKISLSQTIAIVCILAVGFIGLFSLVDRTEAHPKRLDFRYTVYYCYVIDDSGFGELCTSYTDSGSRAVWPWSGHQNEKGPHKPHTVERNHHAEPDNERYTRSGCSKC